MSRYLNACLLVCLVLFHPSPIFGQTLAAQTFLAKDSASVLFDVPAILTAKEIRSEHPSPSSSHRLIAVTVPVTSEINRSEQGNVQAFRFDVFWNRNPFPISDYAPRTQTFSEVAGTIEVDKSSEHNAAYGLKLAGNYPPFATGNANLDGGQRETQHVRYNEVPQHEILVASGTVRRGTGAFFRFHPSRAETLEGGRDLLLTFRVPNSWRGGVLQVECTALGERRFLGMKEPLEYQRAFIVPVYLESDEEAERSAMEFARFEQQLRQSWQRFKSREQAARSSTHSLEQFLNLNSRKTASSVLPENWVHALIQSSDQTLESYRHQLPVELAAAADEFVESRSNLLKLSR